MRPTENTQTVLGSDAGLTWGMFRQRPPERAWRRPGHAPSWLIAFPRTCGMVHRADGSRTYTSPNGAVLYTQDARYTRAHFGWAEEETAFLALTDGALHQAASRLGADPRELRGVFERGLVVLRGQTYRRHAVLWGQAERGVPDRERFHHHVRALLDEVLLDGHRSRAERWEECVPGTIGDVLEALGEDTDDPKDLATLADLVGLSPPYLSRTFHRVVGVPFAQYRERVRLGQAVRRVLRPGVSLAGVAAELGYSSQPHMTTAFRRHLGTTPGRLAAIARNKLKDPDAGAG